MAKSKEGIGLLAFKSTRNKRRSKPKPLRHSKSLGPKSDMRGDKGKH